MLEGGFFYLGMGFFDFLLGLSEFVMGFSGEHLGNPQSKFLTF